MPSVWSNETLLQVDKKYERVGVFELAMVDCRGQIVSLA